MTCQGCHPECSVVQLSVQIYDMFLFGYLYAYYFMQSGSGPASIYTMFQRGSEYLPAARTSGVDPANLRRRVAGVIDGRSSACRFRRDCEPANGPRLTAHDERRWHVHVISSHNTALALRSHSLAHSSSPLRRG